MKAAIMQPYFFPYIGYFQLMNAVDEFIVYDNIEYTKKGWINRNRILVNGKDDFITLPLKKDSDFLTVNKRNLADEWKTSRAKMVSRITESYRKAPFFELTFPLIEKCLFCDSQNLFDFIFFSLVEIKNTLEIQSNLLVSSAIPVNHTLKSEKKVIAICHARKANIYINPIGGVNLYAKDEFRNEGIELKFLRSNAFTYSQFKNEFIPWLSIIDVLMFQPRAEIIRYLNTGYSLE